MGEKLEYYKSFWETYLKYNEGAKMSRTIYNIFPSDVRNDFRIFLFQFLRHVNLQYFACIYTKLLLGTMMTDSELNITIT